MCTTMDPNVGLIDRLLRIAVGLAVLSLALIGPQTRGAPLAAVQEIRA
jgi:hypothetical protein